MRTSFVTRCAAKPQHLFNKKQVPSATVGNNKKQRVVQEDRRKQAASAINWLKNIRERDRPAKENEINKALHRVSVFGNHTNRAFLKLKEGSSFVANEEKKRTMIAGLLRDALWAHESVLHLSAEMNTHEEQVIRHVKGVVDACVALYQSGFSEEPDYFGAHGGLFNTGWLGSDRELAEYTRDGLFRHFHAADVPEIVSGLSRAISQWELAYHQTEDAEKGDSPAPERSDDISQREYILQHMLPCTATTAGIVGKEMNAVLGITSPLLDLALCQVWLIGQSGRSVDVVRGLSDVLTLTVDLFAIDFADGSGTEPTKLTTQSLLGRLLVGAVANVLEARCQEHCVFKPLGLAEIISSTKGFTTAISRASARLEAESPEEVKEWDAHAFHDYCFVLAAPLTRTVGKLVEQKFDLHAPSPISMRSVFTSKQFDASIRNVAQESAAGDTIQACPVLLRPDDEGVQASEMITPTEALALLQFLLRGADHYPNGMTSMAEKHRQIVFDALLQRVLFSISNTGLSKANRKPRKLHVRWLSLLEESAPELTKRSVFWRPVLRLLLKRQTARDVCS